MSQSLDVTQSTRKETIRKIDELNIQAWKVHVTQPKLGLELSNEARELSEKYNYRKGIAYAIRNMGVSNRYLSNLDTALSFSIQALDMFIDLGDKSGESQALVSIGAIYYYMGDYDKGLDYFLRGLQSGEEIGNKEAMTYAYNGAGYIYSTLGDHKKGLEFLQRALTLCRELQNSSLECAILDSVAVVYMNDQQVAHEIQNPLNFVNNFSEVNRELLDELKTEKDEQLKDELIVTITRNEEKINRHGKRADSIVKGMLQHSHSSSGVKEPTDINALAEEYLRLAYHGLKAKDRSFNAMMKTDFDESIGRVNIVPQDIGRVVLNLINNAFYAVDEKKKLASTGSAPNGYEPTVSVSTKKSNGRIEMIVKDNGNGIPQKVLDKIFQPFFTTKPPGQGTGLGLSLAYDIIKADGGEIKVNTKHGKGSEFIIQLRTN